MRKNSGFSLLELIETFNSGKISREKIQKSPKVTINSKPF